MTFAEPFWLWITAAGLLLYAGLLWWSARQRARQLAAFVDASMAESLLASHSPLRRTIKSALLMLSMIAAGIALARPQWGIVTEEVKRRGEDIVFVLDLSKSMLATDVPPNRLDRSKLAILDFVHRQQGGRVGFVGFAGVAFTRVPLTQDYDAFEENVREASPEDMGRPGSDLALALIAGKNTFDKTEKRKVLILLSDGEDLGQNGGKMAEELAKDGVVVFTVGVGTPAGAQIMATDLGGGRATPVLDGDGKPVISKLDEKTLRAIAEATGGRYFPLSTVGGTIGDILKFLRTDELKGGLGAGRRRGIDRYAWPLAVCIFLLVAESLLTTRRRAATVPAP